MAKKENTMATETQTFETPVIITQNVKQAQTVVDLSTGDESAKIELKYTKYVVPEFDAKKYGTRESFDAALFTAAQALVNPVSVQVEALVYRATQDSYQAGKTAALAAGDYLTSELKSKIVQVMKGNQAFVDTSASDCFARWKAGFIAKKAGALKILDTAKALGGFDENDV